MIAVKRLQLAERDRQGPYPLGSRAPAPAANVFLRRKRKGAAG